MESNSEIFSLAEKLSKILKEKNYSISTAESCTGGMIGTALTSVSGISEHYGYGYITYSNEAKMKLLGVREETLNLYGAVSKETVIEMAEGAMNSSGADLAISVSGIAGPGGGTGEKPVGLVYAGFAIRGREPFFEKLNLSGDRDCIRHKTVEEVIKILIKNIE